MVVWATFPSCSRSAWSISGWRWPWTLHQSEDTPSMKRRPSLAIKVVPSARSIISGSSSHQSRCWVNGCQRWS
jgi:hypothetical protein